MRSGPIVSSALLALALASCGGGGHGGSTPPPPPPPPPVTFTAGPTSVPVTTPFATAPFTLHDVAVNPIGDDDAIPDLVGAHSGVSMMLPYFADESMPGVGDGSFTGFNGYGGTGWGPAVRMLAERGDVIGAGLGGVVVVLETSTIVFVETIGVHFSGMNRAGVGGVGTVSGGHADGVAVGDWNGNGVDDIAVADGAGAAVHTFLSNGTTSPDPVVTTPLPAGAIPNSIVSLNVDGDGDDDLAVGDASGGYRVLISQGDGSFTVAAGPGSLGGAARRIELLAAGDFDKDGKADLAGTLVEAGTRSLFTMHGNGNGTFALPTLTALPVDIQSSAGARIRSADFNLDGISDVAFVVPSVGRLAMFLGDGAGGFAENTDADFSGGGNWDSLALADVDGDGDVDLVVVDASGFDVRTLLNDAH